MKTRFVIRCAITLATAVAVLGIPYVHAKDKDPADGPELAKVLDEEYRVYSTLNEKSDIIGVEIDGGDDLARAVDRIVLIPTIEMVSFHREVERIHVDSKTIKKLNRLPKLSYLHLGSCNIDDADTASLAELTNLNELNLTGNPITDRTLAHLKPLKKLELLYLDNTKVKGTGFHHLRKLPRLRNLYLAFTPITDDSLKELGNVHSLQNLDMHNTKISNDGVMHLSGLYLLHSLVVDAKVSREFIKQQAAARASAEKKGRIPQNHPQLTIISN